MYQYLYFIMTETTPLTWSYHTYSQLAPEKGNATLLMLWLSEYANNPALDKPYVGLWTPMCKQGVLLCVLW